MNHVDLTDLTEDLLHLEQRVPANVSRVLAALLSPVICGSRLAFDTFRDSQGGCISATDKDIWRPLTDQDEVELRVQLELRCFQSVSKEMLRDALLGVMERNRGLRLITPMGGPKLNLKPEDFSPKYFGPEEFV